MQIEAPRGRSARALERLKEGPRAPGVGRAAEPQGRALLAGGTRGHCAEQVACPL